MSWNNNKRTNNIVVSEPSVANNASYVFISTDEYISNELLVSNDIGIQLGIHQTYLCLSTVISEKSFLAKTCKCRTILNKSMKS